MAALENDADPWVQKNKAVIAGSLGIVHSHIARVEVIGSPPGADVLVNGSVVGTLPLPAPIHVANGEVDLEVRSTGHASKTKSFHVEGGQYQRVVMKLEKEREVAAALTPVEPVRPVESKVIASADPPVEPIPGATVPTDQPEKRNDTGGIRPALKWAAWGVAVAGLGVGVYGIVRNRQQTKSFDVGCGLDPGGVPRADGGGRTDAECASLKSSYESATVVAVIGLAGAALITAAGFVFWATEPSPASGGIQSGMRSTRCTLGFGREIACSMRF